jgi:hypothetical protein
MGGAREGVGAVGAVGLKLFRRRRWQHANFKRERDSGLGPGGHFGKPTENFQGQTFRSPQKSFWESLEIQSSEEIMETIPP